MDPKTSRTSCDVCNGSSDAMRDNKYWGQNYCWEHDSDGTPKCCACGRLKTTGVEYLNIKCDGRNLCYDCYYNCSPVLDPEQLIPICEGLSELHNLVDARVQKKTLRIVLVDENEMERIRSLQEDATNITDFALTLSHGQWDIEMITRWRKNGGNIDVEKRVTPYANTDNEEEAFVFLFGLPEVIMAGALSTLLIQVWLKKKKNQLEHRAHVDDDIQDGLHSAFGVVGLYWYHSQRIKKSPPAAKDQLKKLVPLNWMKWLSDERGSYEIISNINNSHEQRYHPCVEKLKVFVEMQLVENVHKSFTPTEVVDFCRIYAERGVRIALDHIILKNGCRYRDVALEEGSSLTIPLLRSA